VNFPAGDLNYIISSLAKAGFDQKKCYAKGNEIMGALECAKIEFYRRWLQVLEDKKIQENGDLE